MGQINKIMKKRKEAAKELNKLYNSMETRKNTLATTYRKICKLQSGDWHLIGHGYDYTY